jgi:hypothetical protein
VLVSDAPDGAFCALFDGAGSTANYAQLYLGLDNLTALPTTAYPLSNIALALAPWRYIKFAYMGDTLGADLTLKIVGKA